MAKKKTETYTAQYTHYPHHEEVVDPETGEVKIRLTEETQTRTVEVLQDYVDVKLPKKFKFNNGNFITVFQNAMANLAMFGKLTKGEMQLLLYLIGTCGTQNSVCLDLPKLVDALKMDKGNLKRALDGLCMRNIVVKTDGYRTGKSPLPFELNLNFSQINYNLAYNGKIKDYRSNKTDHPQLLQADGKTPLVENKQQKALPTLEEALFDESYNVNQKEDFEPLHLMNALEEPEEG